MKRESVSSPVGFLNPPALEEAAALDEHFRRTGKFVGLLHGIPVLLKDNVDTNDMPTQR